MSWLWLLTACKEPVTELIPAEDGSLTLQLVNPTTCSWCDAFAEVDEVRIDVIQDGEPIASDTFAWPAESLSLPELDGFGVVQIQVFGVGEGFVVSYGQTPEVAIGPGEKLELSMLFAPVNQALPLSSPMREGRSESTVVTLRDGRVLVAGGYVSRGEAVTNTVELYDPHIGVFADAPYALPLALAGARLAEFASGERIFVGGTAAADGTPSAEAVSFFEEEGSMASVRPMNRPRSGHCLSGFRGDQAVVLGGHEEDVARGELLRVSADDGAWTFKDIAFEDLDESRVTACAPLADGRTAVQGLGAASTGIWTYSSDTVGTVELETAFLATPAEDSGAGAAFVVGASITALADGDGWFGGGVDPVSGELAAARELRAASVRFDPADALPRPRVFGELVRRDELGNVAWGCGWRDAFRNTPLPSVELFNVETGELGPTVTLVDERRGCSVAMLPDGALLVVGGASEPSAELIVPYTR
jgi:hypothetical protein